ncbi:MAG: uncharacterized protein JWO66_1651 [Candidatus Eremiobacteraeota bacterium]|nr:uncharacterized protein [Candidatus Eremiobacteraeota bacterium]
MVRSRSLKHVERAIAIVGCQRSGTTLTGQILGAHPEAVLVDETDGLYPWFHAQADGSGDAESPAETMLRRAVAKYADPQGRFTIAGGRVDLAANVRVLVMKAPNLTFDDDKLARFPIPALAVYPVRDPRAVVASMAKLPHIDFVNNQMRLIDERPAAATAYGAERRTMGDESEPLWVRQATMWRVKSGRARDFARSGIPVHRFRYEDLVTDPDAVIARLLDACGLPASALPSRAHTAFVGYGPGDTDRTRPIDEASVSRWRDSHDEARGFDILRAAGPLATRLGYT